MRPIAGRMMFHGKPCPFCKRAMDFGDFWLIPTSDHYPVPKSKGGLKTIMCCWLCNNIKGNMTAAEWHDYMREVPEWWLLSRGDRRAKRQEKRENERTEKWGPRGQRVIRQDEKPSTPMAESLSVLQLTNRIATDFNRIFGETKK